MTILQASTCKARAIIVKAKQLEAVELEAVVAVWALQPLVMAVRAD